MFGAQCPQLLKVLTMELQRVQNGEEHEYVEYILFNSKIALNLFKIF